MASHHRLGQTFTLINRGTFSTAVTAVSDLPTEPVPAIMARTRRRGTPHDRPTQGTLDSLLYAEDGRIAILGVGSGVAYDYYASMPRARGPAPWWASEEMQRLRAAAHSAGWIFASHYGSTRPTIAGTEIGDLVAAAAQLGGVITCATVRPTTALLRLEFHSVALATPATVPSCGSWLRRFVVQSYSRARRRQATGGS